MLCILFLEEVVVLNKIRITSNTHIISKSYSDISKKSIIAKYSSWSWVLIDMEKYVVIWKNMPSILYQEHKWTIKVYTLWGVRDSNPCEQDRSLSSYPLDELPKFKKDTRTTVPLTWCHLTCSSVPILVVQSFIGLVSISYPWKGLRVGCYTLQHNTLIKNKKAFTLLLMCLELVF